METIDIRSLDTLREALELRLERVHLKMDLKKFVIAGFSGEHLYAYVGIGNGYSGANILPSSEMPFMFITENTAQDTLKRLGRFINGHGRKINLRVWTAEAYFAEIYSETLSTIAMIDSLRF